MRRDAGILTPVFDIRIAGERFTPVAGPGADHELGLALRKTGNADARLLALLLIKPKQLSADELDAMVRAATFSQ